MEVDAGQVAPGPERSDTWSSDHVAARPESPATVATGTLSQISGFWRRVFAFILDGMLIGGFGFVLGLLLFEPLANLGAWGRLLGFTIALAYFGLLNSRVGGGRTLGKRVMKIRVVDQSGQQISVGRAAVRYSVLAVPFFLDGALLPVRVYMTSVGYAMGAVFFGLAGATIYLLLFNRVTRQTVHDLAVGSYVTRTDHAGGPIAGSVWRGHFPILVGLLLLLLAGQLVILDYFAGGAARSPILRAALEEIEASGSFHSVQFTAGETWGTTDGSYLAVNGVLKREEGDPSSVMREMVRKLLTAYPEAEEFDTITVSVMRGFDIGIASGWKRVGGRFTPAEWKAELAEE